MSCVDMLRDVAIPPSYPAGSRDPRTTSADSKSCRRMGWVAAESGLPESKVDGKTAVLHLPLTPTRTL